MWREFFLQENRKARAGAWLGLVVFLGHKVFRVWLKWAVNGFYKDFYDLLGEGVANATDADAEHLEEMRGKVFTQLVIFATIVTPAVVVHPIAGLIRNWWVFCWRRTLMTSFIRHWNVHVPAIEGASQRVQEDTQRFSSGVQGCVSVVIEAMLTLIVFCPVLYGLDPDLMIVAVTTAVGGLFISVVVGSKLVGLEVSNQVVEAELRKRLVVLEVDPLSMDTAVSPFSAFADVVRNITRNYWALYLNFCGLATWLSFYEQACVLLPYFLTAPRIFASDPSRLITLGEMVQICNAFARVFDSLNVVSANWLSVNEFRSVVRRLHEFERQVFGCGTSTPPATKMLADGVEISDAPDTPDPPDLRVC